MLAWRRKGRAESSSCSMGFDGTRQQKSTFFFFFLIILKIQNNIICDRPPLKGSGVDLVIVL